MIITPSNNSEFPLNLWAEVLEVAKVMTNCQLNFLVQVEGLIINFINIYGPIPGPQSVAVFILCRPRTHPKLNSKDPTSVASVFETLLSGKSQGSRGLLTKEPILSPGCAQLLLPAKGSTIQMTPLLNSSSISGYIPPWAPSSSKPVQGCRVPEMTCL
ncbi:unnamed protein product [Caretta caretta]